MSTTTLFDGAGRNRVKVLLIGLLLMTCTVSFAKKNMSWFKVTCPNEKCLWSGEVQAVNVITNGGSMTDNGNLVIERQITIKCPRCKTKFTTTSQAKVIKPIPAIEISK